MNSIFPHYSQSELIQINCIELIVKSVFKDYYGRQTTKIRFPDFTDHTFFRGGGGDSPEDCRYLCNPFNISLHSIVVRVLSLLPVIG